MMQLCPTTSHLLRSKFYSDYSRNSRKAFPNNNFRRQMSEQVLTGPIDKCSIQADIYNYYCERIAIQVCEFVLQTEALQQIPEVDLLDTADPWRACPRSGDAGGWSLRKTPEEPTSSSLSEACERLQVCDFISKNETSNTADPWRACPGSGDAVYSRTDRFCLGLSLRKTTKIDKYNRFYVELDLTDTCNHTSFIIRSTQVLQNMLTDNYYTKNKIVGILKKHYVEKKIIFFKWNDQYDVMSILLHFHVVSQHGNDKFKIYNEK